MSAKFDHEKLDVYQLELEFIEWVTPLLDEAAQTGRARAREVCNQLDRASLSSLLNTAEGNGRRQRQTRAKFFDEARGSATECAACLDAMVAKRIVPPERIESGKELLVRIVSILCRLVDRFDAESGFHEDPASYGSDQSDRGSMHKTKAGISRTRTTTRTITNG